MHEEQYNARENLRLKNDFKPIIRDWMTSNGPVLIRRIMPVKISGPSPWSPSLRASLMESTRPNDETYSLSVQSEANLE